MLVEDIHQPQRDGVVVLLLQRLHFDVVVFQDGFVYILVKESCTNGEQLILVAQFGMKPFPNAHSKVGADAEVVGAVSP